MPRFYFHVSTIDDVFPDEEGVELADLAAAHDCALRIMHRTMLSDPEEQNWRGWMIKIADAKNPVSILNDNPAHVDGPITKIIDDNKNINIYCEVDTN